jgi:multidrug resistance efflux pump
MVILCLAAGASAAASPPPLLITGEVFSRQAQQIIVPPTTSSQVLISAMAPEGSFVEPGTVVVEFDGTEAAQQLEQQRVTARTEQARTDRDLARLSKELEQSRYRLQQAEIDLELASLRADIPEGVIGAIEHAENQLAREEAANALEDARRAFSDSTKALRDRQEQDALDRRKLELQAAFWSGLLENYSIEATQPGYVVYGTHPWNRAKFQEGDNVRVSFNVAQVADLSDLAVKVWINGVDRPRLAVGDPVEVRFDALPGERWNGRIQTISASGAKRQEWGSADYFEGVVSLDQADKNALLPGMSALVEVTQ